MMDIYEIKREFHEAVKLIRDAHFLPMAYPKAVMTTVQMKKGTGTVKCGFGEPSKEVAEFVISRPQFKSFLHITGATAIIERHLDTIGRLIEYRIRINYEV
jgi:hypothetical protein